MADVVLQLPKAPEACPHGLARNLHPCRDLTDPKAFVVAKEQGAPVRVGKRQHGLKLGASLIALGLIDEATLAVCAEAVGIMQIMTDKTVEYSRNRMQFGVPIGSFQALQHRMVDMFTDCEQSYSLLLWATMQAERGAAGTKRAISSIKYQVGTAGRKVGQEAVQIHGGMGVSWEVDIAHYFKRLTVIDQIFGNADLHLDRLAG